MTDFRPFLRLQLARYVLYSLGLRADPIPIAEVYPDERHL